MASVEEYAFFDALTGNAIAFDRESGDARMRKGVRTTSSCTSLFFPGCSFVNYGMPLVEATYNMLVEAGEVDGFSPLCCGKILLYEPNGSEVRAQFEQQFRERIAHTSIKRIVTACPNCVRALRDLLATSPDTAHIDVVPLPRVLADKGYRLDAHVAARLLKGNADAPLLLCPHDSCPDRETGEFASALRDLMPPELYVEPEHNRARSLCCGSLARAAGKFEAADELALRNGQEAVDVAADAIITACMSCAFQLTQAQPLLPVIHYLEILFEHRIDWASTGTWMKLRFLFDETLGVLEEESAAAGRVFAGLGDNLPTTADIELAERAGHVSATDIAAEQDVTVTNVDVETLGE